jgi:NDP-sugar pyrophosphorylase family protein
VGAITLGDFSRRRTKVGTMDLKALILVGSANAAGQVRPPEEFVGVPLAFLDVLGQSVLERVVQRLRRAGISDMSVLTSAGEIAEPYLERAELHAKISSARVLRDELWTAAEEKFEQFRQEGADLILVLRLGAYLELDYEELVQHHIDKHCRMSAVVGGDGKTLGTFVLDASRRGDASALFRSEFQQVRDDCERFVQRNYVNPLQTATDLRSLAMDGLLEKNAIRPVGHEIKPGIWVGEGARIHRHARIVAPAYIGAHSKVRASALITRTSVIEHHAEVDCGTVVENTTILPFTYVGAGLDVMHSVVGFRRLAHMVRNVEVEISDSKLVGMSATGALSRTAGSAAALFALLPKQIYRGFFGRSHRTRPAELPESLEAPAAALETPDVNEPASGQEVSEFPSSFAVVRRYGQH